MVVRLAGSQLGRTRRPRVGFFLNGFTEAWFTHYKIYPFLSVQFNDF